MRLLQRYGLFLVDRAASEAAPTINQLQSGAAGGISRGTLPHSGPMGIRQDTNAEGVRVSHSTASHHAQAQAQIALARGLHNSPAMFLTSTFRVIQGGISARSGRIAYKMRKVRKANELSEVKVYNNRLPSISYQTLASVPEHERNGQFDIGGNLSDVLGSESASAPCAGTPCANTKGVSDSKAKSGQIVPVNNFPADISDATRDDSGIPSSRDLTVYRLRNRIEELRQREKQLLMKLSRCLDVISDTERFLEIGLKYDQWETYDELMRRKAKLRGTRDMIVDLNAEQQVEEQKVKALKEKMRI